MLRDDDTGRIWTTEGGRARFIGRPIAGQQSVAWLHDGEAFAYQAVVGTISAFCPLDPGWGTPDADTVTSTHIQVVRPGGAEVVLPKSAWHAHHRFFERATVLFGGRRRMCRRARPGAALYDGTHRLTNHGCVSPCDARCSSMVAAPVSLATPKFKSKDFKAVLQDLKQVFDAHSLGVILMDALERRAAEQTYGKITKGTRGARLSSLPKAELVGQLTAGFFADDAVAFQILRDLDRTCQKERHIVASIPEAEAPNRIGSYRAISLKRERAKLVWALARDQRPPVRTLANKIIAEFFAEAADVETSKAVLAGDADNAALSQLDMAKRLQEQAERLSEATEQVTDLESKLKRFEDERARLIAQLGAKEAGAQRTVGGS